MRRIASVVILAGCASGPLVAPPQRQRGLAPAAARRVEPVASAPVPGRREAATREAAHHLAEGDARADRGDHRGAIAAYDSALALDPGCARARASRGAALGRLGNDAEQVIAQTEALRDAPGYAYACMTRASARLRLGDLRGAVQDCDRALELIETGPLEDQAWRPRIHWLRGLSRVRLGEGASALPDLDVALLRQDRHVPLARARLARAEARLLGGDAAGARSDLSLARAERELIDRQGRPLSPAELRWLGWLEAIACALDGDQAGAERSLRELAGSDAADVDPAVWLFLLGLEEDPFPPPPAGGAPALAVGWSLGRIDDAAFVAHARGWEGAAHGMIGIRAERAGDLARAREHYRRSALPGPASLPRIWAIARLARE